MPAGFRQRESCPACGARERRELLRIGFDEPRLAAFIEEFYRGRVPRDALAAADYGLVECRDCRLVFQDPVLDDAGMRELYGNWVDQARSLDKKMQAKARLYRQYAGQVATLLKLFPGRPGATRVLDFGMGWGYWARMAAAHGLDVSGFELSPTRRAHAESLGVRVIDRLPEPGDRYDFIFANQVFEHLAEPGRTLRALVERLAPAGVLQIRVPDGRGIGARVAASGWSPDMGAVHPLEHINCFDRRALLAFAAGAGLHAFDPPPRLNWGSLWGGLRREFNDRHRAPHLYLKRT
ncbi:MAG: class I SAM-dependent methyltransferase [Gammaproteobacteria bacterium]|nr:class I SAM-dependent methyltransferase [Gammaproteobacteria bacterium]